MAIFVVKSTDVGAPALSGQNGTFIPVADFALVTTAGYTKAYSGTNKAIYFPPGGAGFSSLGYGIRCVHDSAVSGSAQKMSVRGVESASGIDAYVNAFPQAGNTSDSLSTWTLSSTANSTARSYMFVISDGADGLPPFFYFFVNINSTDYWNSYFWGEVVASNTIDNYRCLIQIDNTSSISTSTTSYCLNGINSLTTGAQLIWARSRDGTIIGSRAGLPVQSNYSWGGMGSGFGNIPYPHQDTGGLERVKVAIFDGYTVTNTAGAKYSRNRGWLPCFWGVLHGSGSSTYTGLTSLDTFDDPDYNPSAEFIFYYTSSSYLGGVIETTPTWVIP